MIILEWEAKPAPLFIWSQDDTEILALQWEKSWIGLNLEWVGPDNVEISATPDTRGERSIAAIIGPPGRKGDQGIQGPQGQKGDNGTYGDLPTTLDGGNF